MRRRFQSEIIRCEYRLLIFLLAGLTGLLITACGNRPDIQLNQGRNQQVASTEAASAPGTSRAISSIGPIRIPDEHGTKTDLYHESYALVIGASNYTQGWPQLQGVKKDVQQVKKTLQSQGFKVVMVENPDYQDLRKAFDDFINRYGLEPDNRLLIYFSGHGHTDRPSYGGEMGYLVPVDAANPNVTEVLF